MLSENLQELLSAYVDGELAPTEYERVMSALRDSAIARDYVTELRSMSQQLKELPTYQTPPQFTKQFLQERKREQLRKRNWRLGSAAAVAAGLLIAASIWWYASQAGTTLTPNTGNIDFAKNSPEKADTPNQLPVVPDKQQQFDVAVFNQWTQEALAATYDQWEQWQHRFNNTVAWFTHADALREGRFLENQSTLLTGPVKSSGNLFKTLDASLPLVLTPADFNLASLQDRWARKGLFVLDVSSKDTIKSLARLIEAGKQAHVAPVVDDEVKQRLAKKLPATFMVYLENITEEQAISFMKALGTADYWQSPEYRNDVTCQSLLLYPLDGQGRSQVARSLGLPPEKLTPANGATIATNAVVLSYYSYRLPTSLSDEARKAVATLQGPAQDRLSLVIMVRAGK